MAAQYESYKKIKELGAGSFGKAFLVECESDKSLAVIKQIDVQSIKSSKERSQIEKEGKILEQLNHINIIGFREVYKTKKGKIWIVMDYADGGDLADKIKNTKEKFEYITEDEVLDYFTQIWLAIKHIHDRKIIHRDLKAQNIFLEKNGTIKLGDFGIAHVLQNTVAKANTQVGTPYYISPEIIKGSSYSFETDIWSLGVILYEMWALDVPIKAKNLHELYIKISQWRGVPALPSRYSRGLQDLVDEILVSDPKKRPTINQILKKDLIKERVKRYLNANEFEEEFSHTILHNQYLFDKRKNRVKPPQHLMPSNKNELHRIDKINESPFMKKAVAPAPIEANWIKQSPRVPSSGFSAQKALKAKKDSASKPGGFRPLSAKASASKNKKGFSKQKSPKGFVIWGEQIKPSVINHDAGRRRPSEMYQEEAKIPREKDRQDQIAKEKARNNQIQERVNNIYKIDKLQEQKVDDEVPSERPFQFAEKPLEKKLGWMKPKDDDLEGSKENFLFGEENKMNREAERAKEKIQNYRKSILKMLDSENEEEYDLWDGLETNREVSEEGDRDDDNIMESSQKSIKQSKIEQAEDEVEKDLSLDSDPEPIEIEGDPYFEPISDIQIEPLHIILKNSMIEKFGVENTERGIDFIKKQGLDIYIESKRPVIIKEFKEKWFNDCDESIIEFMSTVSSIFSLT